MVNTKSKELRKNIIIEISKKPGITINELVAKLSKNHDHEKITFQVIHRILTKENMKNGIKCTKSKINTTTGDRDTMKFELKYVVPETDIKEFLLWLYPEFFPKNWKIPKQQSKK